MMLIHLIYVLYFRRTLKICMNRIRLTNTLLRSNKHPACHPNFFCHPGFFCHPDAGGICSLQPGNTVANF